MSVVTEKGFGWQKAKYLMIPMVLPLSHLGCLLLGLSSVGLTQPKSDVAWKVGDPPQDP